MKKTIFGATNLQVSPICFGTWQLSEVFWGVQSKSEILKAMHIASDSGINFFDTADAYGDGYAETVLGEFVAGKKREDVIICTKVLNFFNPDGFRVPDLSEENIRRRCEIELQRLGIETIDLYLLHGYDPLTPPAEIGGTLESLKKEGKIRHYGVSNFNVEQLRTQRRFGPFDAIQPSYSLLNRAIETDLLPYCQAESVGVMVYSPLHKGLLTGKYQGTESFTDLRQNAPDFTGDRFKSLAKAVSELGSLAKKYDCTIVQLVLAVTLSHPGIDAAIVGIKTPQQIKEAVGAMELSVSREDCFTVRNQLDVA